MNQSKIDINDITTIHLTDVLRMFQMQMNTEGERVTHWVKFITANGNRRVFEKAYTISLAPKTTKELAKNRALRNFQNAVTGERCMVHHHLIIGFDRMLVRW